MRKAKQKSFVDSITGLCGVTVAGSRNSWNVMLAVTYREKDGTEQFSEGAVRVYPGEFPPDERTGCDNLPRHPRRYDAPSMFNRDAARHMRDQILIAMNSGRPVYILTQFGIEAIYATRDFGWQAKVPTKYKVRARRKVTA